MNQSEGNANKPSIGFDCKNTDLKNSCAKVVRKKMEALIFKASMAFLIIPIRSSQRAWG